MGVPAVLPGLRSPRRPHSLRGTRQARRVPLRLLAAIAAVGGLCCTSRPPPASASDQAGSADTVDAEIGATPADSTPHAEVSGGWTVREIVISRERHPGGAGDPSWVLDERWALGSDSFLDYSAYFHNMPINMNHNDDLRWNAGDRGQAVLDTVRSILADPARFAELTALPDDAPAPECPQGCYRIGVERDHADSTFLLANRSTRAFALVDASFTALISAFEAGTGRPLRPGDLPQ